MTILRSAKYAQGEKKNGKYNLKSSNYIATFRYKERQGFAEHSARNTALS